MNKIYLTYLYIALGITTLLVLATKGQPALVKRKVMLGLLILSISAPAATIVSCKSGIFQKDVWETEGWIDDNTYRIYAAAGTQESVRGKPAVVIKEYNKRSAIILAQSYIIEKFKPVHNAACAGMSDYSMSGMELLDELNGVIKGGSVIAIRYEAETLNCEIIYEIKHPGLKDLVNRQR